MIRRIAAALLILVVGGILLVAAWPQLFRLERTPLIAHLVSFRALAALAAAALVLLFAFASIVSRGFRRMAASLCVMLMAFILINAAVLSSRGFDTGELPEPAANDTGTTEVTVLAWNTLGPATKPETIAALALKEGADIVVLPETIAANAEQVAVLMRAGGHRMWVHTLAYDQISPARSTSLLTSTTLGQYDYDSMASTTTVLPTVVATSRDGSGPTIVAVHAVAPIPGQFKNWPKDLQLLAGFCTGENVIMAGDFNATIDHLSGLGAEPGATLGNCTDAAGTKKSGAIGTWPTVLPAVLGSAIDHVMVTRNWTVTGVHVIESLDGNGSDHRPIVARLHHTG